MDNLSKRIFVVHGRNEDVKEAVSAFLTEFRLLPIILHQQANEGRTLIEKFEHHSETGFAVILMTDDDFGREKTQCPENPRARQNVILELGYFIGKLSRKRVCILYNAGVELPSDLFGLVYVPFDNEGNWKNELERELRSAGYDNILFEYKVEASKWTVGFNGELGFIGNCRINIVDDNIQGKVLLVDSQFADGGVDIFFRSHGEVVQSIEYHFRPRYQFSLYALIACTTATGQNTSRWIRFSDDVFPLNENPGETEKAYSVRSIPLEGEWRKIKLDLIEVFRKAFNSDELTYINLKLFRVRGTVLISRIVLR